MLPLLCLDICQLPASAVAQLWGVGVGPTWRVAMTTDHTKALVRQREKNSVRHGCGWPRGDFQSRGPSSAKGSVRTLPWAAGKGALLWEPMAGTSNAGILSPQVYSQNTEELSTKVYSRTFTSRTQLLLLTSVAVLSHSVVFDSVRPHGL